MDTTPDFTARERAVLLAVASVSCLGLNGAFVYGVTRPGGLAHAASDPIALAFVAEAGLLLALLAWLLVRWRVSRISRGAFVALALLGGLAFALPVALLWRGGRPRR